MIKIKVQINNKKMKIFVSGKKVKINECNNDNSIVYLFKDGEFNPILGNITFNNASVSNNILKINHSTNSSVIFENRYSFIEDGHIEFKIKTDHNNGSYTFSPMDIEDNRLSILTSSTCASEQNKDSSGYYVWETNSKSVGTTFNSCKTYFGAWYVTEIKVVYPSLSKNNIYNIQRNTVGCRLSNISYTVKHGDSYNTSLILDNNVNSLENISVIMNNKDVTNEVLTNNTISIPFVDGDVAISTSKNITETGIDYIGDYIPPIPTFDYFNEAPYINTEYYNPIHHIEDNILIEYYVTDYNTSNLSENNIDKEFIVEFEFEGRVIKKKVKIGYNAINLGKATKIGESYFVIRAIDTENNYDSCIHTKKIKIIDDTHEITEQQTYYMTNQDLTTYNIVPIEDSSNEEVSDVVASNNIVGINNLITNVRNGGYRKIIFYNPNGDNDNRYTYYLQPYDTRENSINIPSGLTIDLNKSKIKQKVSYGGGSLLVKFDLDSVDSHLINGYVWGDFEKHIVDKDDPNYEGDIAGSEGEGYNVIRPNGAFNSLKNLDVGYGTGYCIADGSNKVAYGSAGITDWSNVYIDDNGNEIQSDIDIFTCGYQELTDKLLVYNFIQANPMLGYAGLAGKVNDQIFTFFDMNKELINKIKVRQYGLAKIPNNAKYVRITMCSDTFEEIINQSALGFRIETKNYKPTTCWEFNNVFSHDCRTVAYATGVYDHLLYNNCKIKNCGQNIPGKITALAIDVEDGYQHSEGLYINNLIVIPHTKGSYSVNLVTTYDVHMYGVNNCTLNAHKTFGLSLNNTTIAGTFYQGRLIRKRTGYSRVENSHLLSDLQICTSETSEETNIKSCYIKGPFNTRFDCTYKENIYFKDCELDFIP